MQWWCLPVRWGPCALLHGIKQLAPRIYRVCTRLQPQPGDDGAVGLNLLLLLLLLSAECCLLP
jgi:hypothetical protein